MRKVAWETNNLISCLCTHNDGAIGTSNRVQILFIFSIVDSFESSNPSNTFNAYVLVPLSNGSIKNFKITTILKSLLTHLHSASEKGK